MLISFSKHLLKALNERELFTALQHSPMCVYSGANLIILDGTFAHYSVCSETYSNVHDLNYSLKLSLKTLFFFSFRNSSSSSDVLSGLWLPVDAISRRSQCCDCVQNQHSGTRRNPWFWFLQHKCCEQNHPAVGGPAGGFFWTRYDQWGSADHNVSRQALFQVLELTSLIR